MTGYNDIGIDRKLDWPRIRKLLRMGFIASCIVFVGDMLLGWGSADQSKSGIERMLAQYASLSDARIFWSSILGFIGIPLEGLCYFGIYRLMAEKSPKHAHAYRSGILGYLIFGACGVHVPCLASVYFYKYMLAAGFDTALDASIRFGAYFLIPGTVFFFLFFVVLCAAQIAAFARGLTPYPRWCWIFSIPVGMAFTFPLTFLDEYALAGGLSAAWISIGNIWMFGGLLCTMKLAQQSENPLQPSDTPEK